MKIKILCVGKIKERFFTDAVSEYCKRMSKFSEVEIIEAADEKTDEKASDAEREIVLSKEGERLLKNIGDRDFVFILDIKGKKLCSEEFALKIKETMVSGFNTLTFVIGGSLGLSDKVKARGNYSLSFSDMTFPHQLMRVILLEQIYRAFKINAGEPYHK
ncbi:MAG: 23S rRNA (pseudouridine(1915)-N(3))-methyltransferase RlmH [Lachnospiraceae bacterium]|nr:23S rRNA (pseudouridine(1915)-N(3))-methyltransferase RlmH [Lachnospiraceae bacterium]